MNPMKHTLFFAIAASALLVSACTTTPAPRPACPSAQQMDQPELLGRWQASLRGQPGPVTLQLGPHPEWNGSVKGSIQRPAGRSIVVGDVDHGQLTLEESNDGKKVSGTWIGDVVEGSCAREIRGEWLDEHDNNVPFVLRKAAAPAQQ